MSSLSESSSSNSGQLGNHWSLLESELTQLVNVKYRQRNTTLILSLLYPVNLENPHHQDHVVPRARLVESKLRRQGIKRQEVALIMDRRDRLPNLQLLQGHVNVQKSHMAIADFVALIRPADKRKHFIDFHDLGKVPADERDFNRFYMARERVMKAKLKKLVTN